VVHRAVKWGAVAGLVLIVELGSTLIHGLVWVVGGFRPDRAPGPRVGYTDDNDGEGLSI
jgi:hypothetical protein